ncbi:MAG: MaoC/PaaZ C-terminal domain-containing protein, partial [Gemmatimonadota bacterium]
GDEDARDPGGEWRTLRGWTLASSLGRRYAAVSGDVNPIHLFRATARPFGFRSQILHGRCIEALVAHSLVESVLGGDPGALRRITVRFSAPLELPAQVTLQAADRPGGGFFRVVGDPTARPYAEGTWTGVAQG